MKDSRYSPCVEACLKYFVKRRGVQILIQMKIPGRICRADLSLYDFHFQIRKQFKVAIKTINIKQISET